MITLAAIPAAYIGDASEVIITTATATYGIDPTKNLIPAGNWLNLDTGSETTFRGIIEIHYREQRN